MALGGANSKKERKRARGHVVDEDEDPLLECDVVDSTSTAEEIAESEVCHTNPPL